MANMRRSAKISRGSVEMERLRKAYFDPVPVITLKRNVETSRQRVSRMKQFLPTGCLFIKRFILFLLCF